VRIVEQYEVYRDRYRMEPIAAAILVLAGEIRQAVVSLDDFKDRDLNRRTGWEKVHERK